MGMQLSQGRSWARLGAVMAFSLLASACSDGDDTISTADANTMTQALQIKVGDSVATKTVGDLPQGSNQPGEPVAELVDNEVEARAGTVVDVDLVFITDTGVDLTRIFAKIGDAAQYYEIAVSGGAKRAVRGKAGVRYPVSITIPGFIAPGSFTILFSGQNAQGLNSNAVQLLVNLAAAVASTATPAPTATPTPAPTATPAGSPTPAPTATATPNPSASPTPTTSPNPTPTPTPGAGGNATACLNTMIAAVGTTVDQVIRTIDGQSGADLTTTSTSEILGTTTFKGNSASEAESTVQARSQSNPEINSDSTTLSYTRLDGTTLKIFGIVTEAQAQGFTITTTVSNDPAVEDRFDLSPGQSYTQSYTITTETATGFPTPGGAVPAVQATRKRTYVGQESVMVPAGTFTACKFTDETSATTNGQTSSGTTTTWIAAGSGQFLKSVSDGDTSELISASINGTPVTP